VHGDIKILPEIWKHSLTLQHEWGRKFIFAGDRISICLQVVSSSIARPAEKDVLRMSEE
jgi:hypothetical protein